MNEDRARRIIVYLVGLGTLTGVIVKLCQGTPW